MKDMYMLVKVVYIESVIFVTEFVTLILLTL